MGTTENVVTLADPVWIHLYSPTQVLVDMKRKFPHDFESCPSLDGCSPHPPNLRTTALGVEVRAVCIQCPLAEP